MLTKAEILEIPNGTSNKYKVNIPIFLSAGSPSNNPLNANIQEATLSYTPGSYKPYKVGDIVYVMFEDNDYSRPVIIGALEVPKESVSDGKLSGSQLVVSKEAILPKKTKVGDTSLEHINDVLNKIINDNGTSPLTQVQSDWNQTDNTKVDYIKNKPTIPASQVQSDWNQADNTKVDYIKNKPAVSAPTLLWTNPNVDVAFSSQIIAINNLNNYKYITIEYFRALNQKHITRFIIYGVDESTTGLPGYEIVESNMESDTMFERYIGINTNNNTIYFGSGNLANAFDNLSINNNVIIPYKIYGSTDHAISMADFSNHLYVNYIKASTSANPEYEYMWIRVLSNIPLTSSNFMDYISFEKIISNTPYTDDMERSWYNVKIDSYNASTHTMIIYYGEATSMVTETLTEFTLISSTLIY